MGHRRRGRAEEGAASSGVAGNMVVRFFRGIKPPQLG